MLGALDAADAASLLLVMPMPVAARGGGDAAARLARACDQHWMLMDQTMQHCTLCGGRPALPWPLCCGGAAAPARWRRRRRLGRLLRSLRGRGAARVRLRTGGDTLAALVW